MEICLDKQCFAGALLVDLAFDTINHELIIAKLHAYGFSIDFYRWQKVKINTIFSSWTQLLQGALQGAVLGPTLVNIYIDDIFFSTRDVEHNSEWDIAWF